MLKDDGSGIPTSQQILSFRAITVAREACFDVTFKGLKIDVHWHEADSSQHSGDAMPLWLSGAFTWAVGLPYLAVPF